jgi:glycosyltransferase involved in cell wall biosynthesis
VCPFVGEQVGGSERYVYNLSKVQSEKHDVHIYTTTRYLNRVGLSQSNGVTIHRFFTPAVVWNINPLSLMMRALTKSKSDVFHIHSYLYTTSNQAIIAKKLKNRKSLLQLHGGLGIPPYDIGLLKLAAKHFYDRTLGKFTIKNSDLVGSVSKSDIEYIKFHYAVPEGRLRYIPNMVDIDLFKPNTDSSSEEKTLLYLGDLEPWKGIGTLIKWIYAINRAHPDEFTIRFVGQGSCMKNLIHLREYLRKSGNGVSVEILGQKNHNVIPFLLRESSALVLPSYWEGLPTVVLEAMASGIPVISTPVGDVPHLIKHNKTGILIGRSLKSFRDAVQLVMNDSPQIRRIVGNARKLIEREYNPTKLLTSVNNVYSELC